MTSLRLIHWLYGALIFTVATAISYELIDPALSFFAHIHWHDYPLLARTTTLTEYFPPAAVLIVFVVGVMQLSNRRLSYWLEAVLLSAVSLIVARAAKDQLKYVFGRTWPETWTNNNPSLIKDGAYGFHPFHGGTGFESFPSGHSIEICAVVVALWLYYPRLWPIYVSLVLLIAASLIGANYHFLSDIIAGAFVGATSAIFCVAMFGRQCPVFRLTSSTDAA